MHGMAMQCWRCSNAVRGVMLGAENHPGMIYRLQVIIDGRSKGGKSHVRYVRGGGWYMGSVFLFVVFF